MRPQLLPLFLALYIGSFSAISLGDASAARLDHARRECRAQPGKANWPVAEEWSKLNVSLGGALLQPSPLAAAFYPSPLKDESECKFILEGAGGERVFIDDPLTIFTQWPLGDTCYMMAYPQTNCTQGGFPSYMVNVTTIRQIQNAGHEFFGRSTEAGSLRIWTHYLKCFEYLPEYTQGEYQGRASRVGAGLES
ncbi:hypothetical protein BJ875DRAFT_488954 [Amylocarpus encephaloides]|uniref:Ecp2 effector protein domain-containing protein n=1 Tax=Amylocarpus encephaloides TaxID=45428 RepID=A0A9P7Y951_9HELO|nr:hypothetical protein BJ875DRAFT_488954 [Amylocarpus encephaloides]